MSDHDPRTRSPDLEALRIGEVAAMSGVSTQTLRFYEREGLLPSPRRSSSGYRAYSSDIVHTVRFIKHAQGLGYTLREIAVLRSRAEGPDHHCDRAREVTMARIIEVDRKIAELQAIRDSLREMVAACGNSPPGGLCPIAEAIDASTRWTIPIGQMECPHARPPSTPEELFGRSPSSSAAVPDT